MPFRKLWNSLTGRGNEAVGSGAAGNGAAKTETSPVVAFSEKPSASSPGKTSKSATVAATQQPTVRSILSMGSRKQADDLGTQVSSRLQKGQGQRRVLEIGVGDGSRTAMLLSELAHAGFDAQTLSYIVIDQFEMGGSVVTLKDFHGRLKGVTPRPSIVPDSLATGLTRVLHTYGLVDVILIDPSVKEETISENDALLAKVQQPGALVLRQFGTKWAASSPSQRKAA